MNDTQSLREVYIADEIQRIELLTQEQLVRELVEIQSVRIDSLSDMELLNKHEK